MSTKTAGAAEVEAVVESLRQIELDSSQHLPLKEHDGLACFDFLYTKITENVLRCVIGTNLLPRDPVFHDPDFMAAFDVAFADRFFRGIGMGTLPIWQTKSWKVLLDHRQDRDISPLIFAVAGVNAHVNFDLPFAVVTACQKKNLELGEGTTYEDYGAINDIFNENMQNLRHHFEGRFLQDFDKGPVCWLENHLCDFVVRKARKVAWDKAMELWPVRDNEAEMIRRARSRDRWVAWVTTVLFAVDRIPATIFKVMHLVPGPSRQAARRGLRRTGWAESDRYQRPR